MRKTILACTMAVTFQLLISPPLHADERPSCEDLKGMVTVLDELADAIQGTTNIRENSSLEKSLGELVDALLILAQVENNDSLTTAAGSMKTIWERDTPWEDDLPAFKMALDSTIMSMDRIYHQDCK